MLTSPERLLFVLFVIATGYMTWHSSTQVIAIIRRGSGKLALNGLLERIYNALGIVFTQRTVVTARPITSLIHFGIVWGFIFFALVNIGDVLDGFGIEFFIWEMHGGTPPYRFAADVFSVIVIIAMVYFLVRRFGFNTSELQANNRVLLPDDTRAAVRRDSAIVGAFILTHVGARFYGQAFKIALGEPDTFQPFANVVANLLTGLSPSILEALIHFSWWLAIGAILAFIPWFPQSKHFHLIMGPINFLTTPSRRGGPGTMAPLDLEDENIELFGAANLEELSKTQIIDAYACIMCNRCQDVCPAYNAGTALSPAALEINKRYLINHNGGNLAQGGDSPLSLFEAALSAEGLWACTTCAACIEICPVGNEPMHDILNMRQYATLMEGEVPSPLATAFNRAERAGDPWGNPQSARLDWAKGLDIPVMAEKEAVDVLYWIGCAGAFDPAGQRVSQAMVQILTAAAIDFAVLGEEERCNCEWARRSGQEALFQEAAAELIDIFNKYTFNTIVTQCPHCFNTFKNEYPDFGGNYEVMHHSTYIAKLLNEGKLKLDKWDRRRRKTTVTYHDSCFLGRYNGIYDAPRDVFIAMQNIDLIEMTNNRNRGTCCGGGGAQVWMETHQETPINDTRLAEAAATEANIISAACPFCSVMLNSAAAPENTQPGDLKDIAELVIERLA